jgi:hypothetical protein
VYQWGSLFFGVPFGAPIGVVDGHDEQVSCSQGLEECPKKHDHSDTDFLDVPWLPQGSPGCPGVSQGTLGYSQDPRRTGVRRYERALERRHDTIAKGRQTAPMRTQGQEPALHRIGHVGWRLAYCGGAVSGMAQLSNLCSNLALHTQT